MTHNTSLEESYLVFFKFMMQSKHRVIEIGNQHSLTGMQTMMIFLLDHPRPMNVFSKIFNCDASNVTGIVDGLEQKKLALRYEDKNDRRIKIVKLETRGQKLRNTLLQGFTVHNSPMLSKLNPQELQTFIDLLRKITTDPQEA